MISEHDSVDVFIGIDVGKSDHHAVGIDRAGKKLLDKPLPQDEAKLRALISKVSVHGAVLVVVDQPATIGALPVAVAQDMGVMVGYLPGLAMRRIADLHPGQAKTDARDAAIIAEAARSMPHTLRSIALADEQAAQLTMLCGFDDDLAKQATATVACSPRSTPPSSASSASTSTIPSWLPCWPSTPPRPRSRGLARPEFLR